MTHKSKGRAARRSSKAILLTLITIVLFILMLAELITYVTLNINYDNTVAQATSAFNSGAYGAEVNQSISDFLHTALKNAVLETAAYEGNTKARGINFLNDTALTLYGAIQNDEIFGSSVAAAQGPTLQEYISQLEDSALLQNINLTFESGNLSIRQYSPFSISAQYYAIALINSSGTISTYPISANATVALGYLPNIPSYEQGLNSTLIPGSELPRAEVIGNMTAESGSRAPFMFVYGKVLYVGPTVVSGTVTPPTCTSVPSSYQNQNYILAVNNSVNVLPNICGMGGLITHTLGGSPPDKPYLVYSSNAIMNYTKSGPSALLYGPGLELLNITPLDLAMQQGYYYASPYASSYLDMANGDLYNKSNQGIFSFGEYGREVATFNGVDSQVLIPPSTSLYSIQSTGNFTLSLWFLSNSIVRPQTIFTADKGRIQISLAGPDTISVNYGKSITYTYTANVTPGKWNFIALERNTSAGPPPAETGSVYLNGALLGSAVKLGKMNLADDNFYIGNSTFNGSIANVQLYNQTLYPSQIMRQYKSGISGRPANTLGLIGWWPLYNNTLDYSGKGNNGTNYNALFADIKGYDGNPLISIGEGAYSTKVASFNPGGATTPRAFVNTPVVPLDYPEFSYSAWFYATSPESYSRVLATSAGDVGAIELATGGATQVYINGYGTGGWFSVQPNFPLRTWNLVTAVYNGTAYNVYLNGVLIWSKAESLSSATKGNFEIGSTTEYGNGGNQFFGYVKNVQIYDAPLTQSQIQQEYQYGLNGGPVDRQALLGWYPLNGNANDYSGNGNNGQLNNITSVNLPNDPTTNLVEGAGNCNNLLYESNNCSKAELQHLYLASTPLEHENGGFENQSAALGFQFGVVPDVADFYGNGGYITTAGPGSAALNPSDEITVAAWIKPMGPMPSGDWPTIVSKTNAAYTIQACQPGEASGTTITFWINSNGNGNSCNFNTLANVYYNHWYFVLVTYNGSTATEYINGTNVGSYTFTTTMSSSSPLGIGAYGSSGPRWNGSIADVQIYDTYLTNQQVDQLYLNNSVIGAQPAAYWPLSTGLNGTYNETPDVISGNTGYLYSNGKACTESQVVDGFCGVEYGQP
ncbi:MAG: LamG domain-containing protein [Candidatus Micrarchaeales archaeon]|jgi:hypothetical protein|uniref:LamG domain protein jellyroll fold domain protein n=1 Tax=Candidatus Micrarchaeum acidiphilum ARMAN-2 TaxID=425595 RepID=C7DG96_MICA2|nr:MAG: LamG domain protein jellyroll fold domain protein [Candidatus Micrarchaeum acidiphilum ARMAN-2]MCW6161165.1 LamG domain-containing protein [Candidatus Micrarchaeales archaeon]